MPSNTALAYLLICSLGFVATVWRTPFYGILLYELHYFADPVSRWWYSGLPALRYSMLIMLLVVVGYSIRAERFKENKLLVLPQFKWLALMACVVLITYCWAVSPELHLQAAIRYLKIVLFALMAYKVVDTPAKLEKLFGVYLAGIFYVSWLAWQSGRTGDGRLEGVGCADATDANGVAAVFVTAVPLLMFYVLSGRRRWVRLAALLVGAFVLNSLVLFNSRGGFVGVLCGALYLAWFLLRERGLPNLKVKLAGGLIGAAALFLYLADSLFWSRMSTLQDTNMETGGHRLQFWMKTFDMLGDHPLGTGADGYLVLSPLYLPPEWLSQGGRVVHSIWFQVLSEYSFHGLLLFIGYIVSTFLLLGKVRSRLRERNDFYHLFQSFALGGSFLSLLVSCTFINYFYGELIYWLPLYIGAFANIHLFKEEGGCREVD